MQSETLAQEFARLVKEYHEGDDHTKPEAWNLLADYAVDNADAISAALSDKQAGEVKALEWRQHIRNGPYLAHGVGILYAVDEDHECAVLAKHEGSSIMKSAHPHAEAAKAAAQADYEQRIRSALVDVPAVAPVAWLHPTANWSSTSWDEIRRHCFDDDPMPIPLYTSPPLSREGEDSAEVFRSALQRISELTPSRANAKDARDLHLTVKAIADAALAATRSGSATSAKTWGEWEREKQSEEDQ